MGAVYKASDPALDRVVAIKTINPALLAGDELRDEYLERFRREARAAGRLSHPNIVSVFDLGFDEETVTPFIVMEYVPGVSLETVLKENPTLPLAQAMEIVEQVGSALQEAHRNGIVHRDIKPANIFLDERGRVKVGDFGVARLVGSELTQTGVRVGTPGYTAPEVLQGGVADARADVFALGVLAYRVFTGKRPFSGTLPETLAIDILQREPSPPAAVRTELSEQLSTAVMRALAKSPGVRTPSARAFLQELRTPVIPPEATSTARPQASATPSMPTRTDRSQPIASGGRRWLPVAAVVAAALVLGLAAFLANRALSKEQAPAAAAPPLTTPITAPATLRRPSPAAPHRGEPGRDNESQASEEEAALERARAIVKAAEELWHEGRNTAQKGDKKAEKKNRGQDKKARERGKKDR
jgi:serine/threonine-protein kinase